MIELGSVIRAVVVQVSNSTWVTTEQFQAELERHRRELDSSLAAISLQLDNLIDEVEIQQAVFNSAGDHLDMFPGKFGYIVLAIDGDGEEFEANIVVLCQARKDGEFIPVKLIGVDGVVTEASSKTAIYKVLAPRGHLIRAVASKYASGNVHVTLSATASGSY